LHESNKTLDLVQLCMTKEVIVPLKGMTQMLLTLMNKTEKSQKRKDINLIFSTTQLLLA